ncbi:MAG TPA: hypothetical protein VFB66_01715 [Tepidisphaeraceae bacterium]|nr:hypothetical protein [Tepidisphaeraceae bacterium]
MSDNLPGKGVFGWLGRQVGYVKKAVRTKPAALPKPEPRPTTSEEPPPSSPAEKLYENRKVEEVPHPENPQIKLRRTIIDEAIVDPVPPPPDRSE